MLHDKQTLKVIENFKNASNELNFKMQCFYKLYAGFISYEYPVYLPEFGGINGMVIGFLSAPDFKIEKESFDCAKENNVYFSRISVSFYEKYDIEIFKEALIDWGYFGSQNSKPNWI